MSGDVASPAGGSVEHCTQHGAAVQVSRDRVDAHPQVLPGDGTHARSLRSGRPLHMSPRGPQRDGVRAYHAWRLHAGDALPGQSVGHQHITGPGSVCQRDPTLAHHRVLL